MKAKHVDMQNLWIQEASKSGEFVTKKVGTNVNSADLMTKPLPRPKIEQIDEIYGLSIRGAVQGTSRATLCKTGVVPTKCTMKFDHGVLAVGHVTVSDTD